MPTVLVTGANRGLGLEFVRQYAAEGASVHACARAPAAAEALQEIARRNSSQVHLHALDIADFGRIEALGRELADVPVDILLNNAGIYGPRQQNVDAMDFAGWAEAFTINTMAPFKMAQTFRSHLRRGRQRKLVTISSQMGSIHDNNGGYYAYRSSKAAVNAVVKGLAHDLAAEGIIAVALHPGWVRTDMGGSAAPLLPEESVAHMRRLIAGLGPHDSGRFLRHDGTAIAW
jgi:NAD(P)-dependent dehydrogenase (short-subunit alcohol dehydrogenase family)